MCILVQNNKVCGLSIFSPHTSQCSLSKAFTGLVWTRLVEDELSKFLKILKQVLCVKTVTVG